MPQVWTLVYETDSSGNQVAGSLTQLRKAVLNAADVKVIYKPSANTWWSRYCDSVTVRGGGSQTVIAATFMNAADTTSGVGGLDFEDNPFAVEHHIYNSSGRRAFVKLHYKERDIIQNSPSTIPMKWFVKDYTIPWVFELDAVALDLDRERKYLEDNPTESG